MNDRKLLPYLITGLLVTLFFGLSLYFRTVLPHDSVFVGEWIKFTGTDAWYHMRIISNLAHNFPHLNSIDPYLLYPSPMPLGQFPFFDYFVAAIIRIITMGTPTQQITDMVGVYLPAVLGALVVIPVFFIGKALVNRWAGIIAAGLMAFSPGEFLGRSIIGQADHHVFEVLCSTTAMMFIILALQNARQKQLDFSCLLNRNYSIVVKPLIYSFLTGILLTIYLNSWLGAILFVFILFVYMVIQFIIDYVRLKNSAYLCIVFSMTFLITLIVTVLLGGSEIQLAALAIAFLSAVVLGVLSHFMMKKSLKARYYPLAMVCLGLAAILVLYLVKNDLFLAMLAQFKNIVPAGARLTIEESNSILFPGGQFSLEVAWLNFTTGSLLSLIALGILINHVIKNDEADTILIIVWSLFMLGLTLLMRRFAYYFAVDVAILTAYAAWLLLKFFGFRDTVIQADKEPVRIHKKAKHKKSQSKVASVRVSPVIQVIGILIVFFLVLFPDIIYARNTAKYPPFTPSNAWCESMDWLKENTPEPYGDPEFYYALYDKPFKQPSGSYGIAAQWDFGYWIAKFAHRPPLVNPGVIYKRKPVSEYFLSQDEKSAVSNVNARNSRYIIMDYDTAMPLKKYYSFLQYAGIDEQEFYDVYIQRKGSALNAVVLYYPEYYRSLAVRLYNFDGEDIVPEESIVISYDDKVDRDGTSYKEITSLQTFSDYDAAQAYLEKQTTGNFRLVGSDPFISPVPLDALRSYKLVFSSTDAITVDKVGSVPIVKVFEYSAAAGSQP